MTRARIVAIVLFMAIAVAPAGLFARAKVYADESVALRAAADETYASARFRAEAPASGAYNLLVSYVPLGVVSGEISVTVTNSGKVFDLGAFAAESAFVYGSIERDAYGDDLRPRAGLDAGNEKLLRRTGVFENEPIRLTLAEGDTGIDVRGLGVVPTGASLVPVSGQEAEAVAGSEPGLPHATTGARVQAERIFRTSASTLTGQYDRSDAAVEPADPTRLVLNIAGGEGWRDDGQWMEWEIDAPETARYVIRIKARQNAKEGSVSNRRLTIDGAVPVPEAHTIAVAYASSWQLLTLTGADGAEAPVPLSQGRHVIRLEVVPGETAEAASAVRGVLAALNDMYRRIIMITGTSPDVNRDYYLERDIPDLLDEARRLSDELKSRKAWLTDNAGYKAEGLVPLTTAAAQLDSFAQSPETIPARVGSFKGNIDGLSAWLYTMTEQPLDLDYIEICPPGAKPERVNAGFWQNLVFGVRTLLASFTSERRTVNSGELDVWVTVGRDQMRLTERISDELFTAETGIKARFSVVTQGVNEAILAGSGPDIVLYAPSAEPASLAMRGALAPLDGYDGFDALRGEWHHQSTLPYEYAGHVYAVPLTQSFPVMFYRTDILDELGIAPPQTWAELAAAIPVVQRKNMQVGVPSGEQTFATMLFQNGMGFYNEDRTATAFSQRLSVDAFKRYTGLFSDYGLPLTYDFFNRFRSGEMPIAIADYTECNRLNAAAREIAGLWEMALIPGTERGGTDHSTMAGSGQGAYILASSEKKEQAWAFLRWFAGYEAQAEFGLASEALLGAAGRYAPANILAFDFIPWSAAERALLKRQWAFVRENPMPPGAYYVGRNLQNAFRNVVLDRENPREMLDRYGGEIDRELARKRMEYSDSINQ